MTFTNIKTAEQIEAEKKEQQAIARIDELKRNLRDTDYVSLSDYDKDKPDVIAQRAEWRNEIRQLADEYNLEA